MQPRLEPRLGAHLGQQNLTMAQLQNYWRAFDEHLDWISAWDHFYEAPPQGGTVDHFETVATLAALALTTQRAAIGVHVMYVGYRSPAVIAKAASTIDHLSKGRFELGLGAGWHEPECKAFGYPFPSLPTRFAMLEESTQIVRGLLTNDRTTFRGEHFSVDNASALPRPVQERLPIWIGGVGEKKTLRLVAKYADGWNSAYVSPTEFGRLNGVLDEWCKVESADGSDNRSEGIRRGVNLVFNLGSTADRAAELHDQMVAQWRGGYDRIAGGVLSGTPDSAVDRVIEYIKAGASDVNIALRAPFDDDALNIYMTEIVPEIKRRLGT